MKLNSKHITVFEHQSLKLNQVIDGVKFDERMLKQIQAYHGENGVPYFTLIHNGIRFNEYVGVIQIGETIFEILPKADNCFAGADEKTSWRNVLIDMLFAVSVFDIKAPSNSSLKLRPNSILDLYFELFILEVESLLHKGLIKQYNKKEGNVLALKGNLLFSKQIQHNLTHQERFYVRFTNYDVQHNLHKILYKTILLLKQINNNVGLHSRIGTLLLHFPEMSDIKVTEVTFDNLVFNRKNHTYKKAIDIAKLLLLQFHPDVSKGRNNVLALMFDMNKLWEQFVYASLRKHKEQYITTNSQFEKYFWKPERGRRSKMIPDIVINKDKPNCVVLDTKWKNLNGFNPSPDDLRQMYVYHEYFGAKRVALVYPGTESNISKGSFLPPKPGVLINKECSVISLKVEKPIKNWQRTIYITCENWLNFTKQD